MERAFFFDADFWNSVEELQTHESHGVIGAVNNYRRDPSGTGLRVEKLNGRAGNSRLWSLRASQELRVLMAREGPTTVFLRAGHHDAIYGFAERCAFVAPLAAKPGLIGLKRSSSDDPKGAAKAAAYGGEDSTRQEGPSIVEHWSTVELTRAGFSKQEVGLLRRSRTDTLLEVWPDIDVQMLDKVMACIEKTPDDWFQAQLVDDEDATNERFRDAIIERGALAGLSSLLTAEELERLMSAPIEDWMIFLHPDQRALVERRFSGPARVRGSAGTGKTVVALHRAASLAQRFAHGGGQSGRILFTTFISTLPPVFSRLYQRLPAAIEGDVEFINIDKLAGRVCAQAGQPPRLNPSLADREFNRAFATVVRDGSPLNKAGLTRRYLKDEVTAVIKGRGVASLDEYMDLDRHGRRTPFNSAMREEVWTLRTDWDRRLRDANVEDFPDVVLRARGLAERRRQTTYAAAIVDECQDLTLVGLQLVRALVNGPVGHDVPDGLFLVGDGAQKIYPGGFTLSQAGIDVRGSSTVLRVNYRNTREIIEAAMACAGGQRVDDLGDEYTRVEGSGRAPRPGVRPRLVSAGSFSDQIGYVAARIEQLRKASSFSPGDACVCAPTNALVNGATKELDAKGFACQSLSEFDGHPNERLKVGTFHRAKGLEFKVVFLLGLTEGRFPSLPSARQSAVEHEERWAMQISELFVAMTRARDGLFLLYDENPSDVVYEALDYFDEE